MSGRYVSGTDFPVQFGPNWRHTSDITLDIRDQWGSPMHGVVFRVVIQAGSDPVQSYLIPGGSGVLRPAGFFITLINTSIALRGFIHLSAYTCALRDYAMGSVAYRLQEPNSRQPRHPLLINARLQYRSGSLSTETSDSTNTNPDTISVSATTGVSAVIANTNATGTRNFGYQATSRGTSHSISGELREELKTFDMQQQG